MNWHSSIAGLLVGFLVGLTGMGGGALMAPVLIYLFHYKAKVVVGSDLVYVAIAKVFGSWQHHKAGTVNTKLSWQLALGSVPGSLLGVYLLHAIDKKNAVLADHVIKHLLGAMLILVAAVLIARSIPRVEQWLKRSRERRPERGLGWAIGVGLVLGFLVGMTSVGGGTLFSVALLLVFGLGAREMVGTDIFHALLLSSAAALGHVLVGDVDYPLVGSLLIGAIPGVIMGSRLSTRVPERVLRPTLATVLLISGAMMM